MDIYLYWLWGLKEAADSAVLDIGTTKKYFDEQNIACGI